MKVKFECEKHGHVYYEADVPCANFDRPFIDAAKKAWDGVGENPCPNCAKLTYGPLTEEMVAEALDEADRLSHGDPYTPLCRQFLRQSRFVLRLLRAAEDRDKHHSGWNPSFDYRAWLLDLARQP